MEKRFLVSGSNLLLLAFVSIATCIPSRAHASGEPPATDAVQAVDKSVKGELNQEEQMELLRIARNAVETYIRTGKIPPSKPAAPALNEKLGVFVTLKEQGQLRGCIGRFEPNIPLYQVVTEMAVAAATQDPRFSPVTVAELSKLDYEISVLSPLRKAGSADEIVVGTHGVQVQKGFRGGVFLPQIATENNWNKETFLSVLCMQKAGLPPDCWKDPGTRLSVFTAQVFGEKE